MVDNIVDFGKFKAEKPDMVYECYICGGQEFKICDNGWIKCDLCKSKTTPPKEWLDKAYERFDQLDAEEDEE